MNALTIDTLSEQRLIVDVVRGEPDGYTEIITNVFGMPHAKFDCFEIRVFVMSYLVTIYQRVTYIEHL
jgi:hypothetical protein